jgi:hypothetical protein
VEKDVRLVELGQHLLCIGYEVRADGGFDIEVDCIAAV